jgi:hypothetical protein
MDKCFLELTFKLFEEIKSDIEGFNKVVRLALERYPTIIYVNTPTNASLVDSSEQDFNRSINISPIQIDIFESIDKEQGIDESIKLLRETLDPIFKILKANHFKGLAISLMTFIKAKNNEWDRPLIKGLDLRVPDEVSTVLGGKDYRPGLRLTYEKEKGLYSIIVEPYFEDPNFNYLTVYVDISKEINLSEAFNLAKNHYNYTRNILSCIHRGDENE